jgi:predicted dehydrogenase
MGKSETLKAVVLGTGYAGKGHAEALRYNGVEIAGMVGRTDATVRETAAGMGIPYASLDWMDAFQKIKPDIVAVGTPGGAHVEPIHAALDQGISVVCDKPLAPYAGQAKELYLKAKKLGMKTAYAASFRYQPHVLFAKKLVADGAIGEPWEAECVSHFGLDPLIPFGWSHRLDDGGGRLNNNFTHKLSIILHILNGELLRVSGETRNDLIKAPIVSGVHDFRYREQLIPPPESLDKLSWGAVDSDWSYSVLASVAVPGVGRPFSGVFRHAGIQPRFQDDYIAVYGSSGAIFMKGFYAQGPLFLGTRKEGWKELALPRDIVESLPDIEDDTQRNWTQLMKEFVANIRGEGPECYQTFRDGWIYQEAVDAVRAGRGWVEMPGRAGV